MSFKQLGPSVFNSELLPNRIDEIARTSPDRTWAEYPASESTYEHGFKVVTYKHLANAVDGTAKWFVATFGPGKDFETVAYCGPNDLRYPIVIFGAVKAGYKILLTSPRNSLKAQSRLYELTACRKLVVSEPVPAHVSALSSHLELRPFVFPSLAGLLYVDHEHFAFGKTFRDAHMEPLFVLHTSGSTGLPKPLVLPHAFATRFANNIRAATPHGYVNEASYFHGVRLLHTMPMFHSAGLYHALVSTIFCGTEYIVMRSDVPPSGWGVEEALRYVRAEAVYMAPSIVEETGKDSTLLEKLRGQVQTICFAGGGISKPLGDKVASRIRLISLYGSAEWPQGIQMRSTSADKSGPADWSYHQWYEAGGGMEFREEAEGLFQMFIVKEHDVEDYQPPFTIFPTASEFTAKDLFRRHPSQPGLWRHAGRTDDIIVLSNGEKHNPVTMEGQISSHPKVRSALVAGEKRLQTALLVELQGETPTTAEGRAILIEELWPTIAYANEECPAFAKISKDLIIFVDASKPMIRAGKGTVVRRATLSDYAKELDDLYDIADSSTKIDDPVLNEIDIDVTNIESVRHFVLSVVQRITHWNSLGLDDKFFQLGMDSLHAIQICRFLKSRFPSSKITINLIYLYPSVNQLTKALYESFEEASTANNSDEQACHSGVLSTLQRFLDAISTIGTNTGNVVDPMKRDKHDARKILLTGSSGFVGSYILKMLVDNPYVEHVYCLDRPSSPKSSRHRRERFEGYVSLLEHSKVTALEGTLSEPNLGLFAKDLQALSKSVQAVVHAAWSVDFNRTLDEYDDQLSGLVRLAEFSVLSTQRPRIYYVSSTSSVQHIAGTVLETVVSDANAPARSGYGESKHVAERLLDHAAEHFGLDVTVLRAGQIAGPADGDRDGGWNKYEWIPSLVASSAFMGLFPKTIGHEVDWVPVDRFADAVVDLVTAGPAKVHGAETTPAGAKLVHLVNPNPVAWSDLLPAIVLAAKDLRAADEPKVVSFERWLEALEADALSSPVERNPAVKLLPFYKTLLPAAKDDGDAGKSAGAARRRFSTTTACETSRTMRDMQPIRAEWMVRWMQGWL